MLNQETPSQDRSQGFIAQWLALALVVAAILAGWFVPEFYDWTGADQSRPAPVVGWIALSILVVDVLLFVLLARLHYLQSVLAAQPTKHGHFSLKHVLMLMTFVAVFLFMARLTSLHFASYLLEGIVVAFGIWIAIQYRWTRWWIAWIAIVQVAPFLWVLRKMAVSSAGPSVLALLTSLPALLPVAFFVRPNDEGMQWLFTLTTTAEFAIGLWLSYLGQKRTIAFGIVVLTLSIFGSFLLNAGVRA